MSPIFPKRETGALSIDTGGDSLRIRIPVMIKIPAGPFLMGTSNAEILHLQLVESDWAYDWHDHDLFENEQPQHELVLPDYEIAQNPVTNAEYSAFVWDTGHPLPRQWHSVTYVKGREQHPVISVSKDDAEAYCKWLSERLNSSYRLPTEAEWEKAARSADGRVYPWGSLFDPWRCNTAESMKRDTTPVGSYSPGGDSPCGAVDMIGNVWEWTSTVFKPYPYDPLDGREEQQQDARYVIRGGAWYYSRKLARCAARESEFARRQTPSLGFRLARSA